MVDAEVIERLKTLQDRYEPCGDYYKALGIAIKRMGEPGRKTGKWIRAIDPDVNAWTGGHTCSKCGRACVQMSMNYCANCGAPMEVET